MWFVTVTFHRVTAHVENMENVEKSGNSKVVREKSGETELNFIVQLNYQWHKYCYQLNLLDIRKYWFTFHLGII